MQLRVFCSKPLAAPQPTRCGKPFWTLPRRVFIELQPMLRLALRDGGVRIREQLGLFPRADLGDGVEYPFGSVLGQQLGFGRQAGSSAMLRRAQLLLNRHCTHLGPISTDMSASL
jgi:hypothetical protein